ncbi:MAG: TolC family protein [Cyanobacteria bacterium RUI128]|nr:TolC family protein [Cyanobacteria bacterium RUI128]
MRSENRLVKKLKTAILSIVLMMLCLVTPSFSAEPIQLENQDIPIAEGASLTLEDCIGIALSRSPRIKQMKYYWQLAKHNVSIAKAQYFPTLSAGAGYNQGWDRTRHMTRESRILPSADVRLKELIWNFGKTNANIRMEKFYKIAAEHDFNQEIINTIYQVKIKYYAVLAAQAIVEIDKANVQINERNYQRTKAYFEEGIRSKIDLVNAEVYLSDSKIALVQAEKDYKNSLIALSNAMYVANAPNFSIQRTETFNFDHNYLPVSLLKITNYKDISNLPEEVFNATLLKEEQKAEMLKDYVFKNKFPMTFEESVQYAYDNRYDLKSLQATKEAMKQALLYTKREYYPELTGSVGYGYLRNKMNDNSSFDIAVEVSSALNPLQTKHKIDNAKIQVNIAQNDIDELKQDLYFDIQRTYVDMIALEEQIPLNASKVRQTLENLELADGRYEVGLGDYIEVQDAKANYNSAQHTYIQNIFNYNVSRATMEKEIASEEITLTLEDKADDTKRGTSRKNKK